MAVSADVIACVRRMVAEPENAAPWDDETISMYIERYALRDASGLMPDDEGWTPTYDLNAAARDIWNDKAAALASEFDVSVDGTTARRSQRFRQARRMAAYYGARAVARVVAVTRAEDAAEVLPGEV